MLNNKNRGQIGETMTWVVATIVIIAILIISVYAASLLANTKKTLSYQKEKRESDFLMEKSLFAYFSVNDTKKNLIYDKLKQQEFDVDLDEKRDEIKGVLG
jgi:hypothetical protein